MAKFDDFVNDTLKHSSEYQKLEGDYGCQLCEKQTPVAYFDEKTGEIFWYCSDKHKSSIQVA